jgi:hypothetical protein
MVFNYGGLVSVTICNKASTSQASRCLLLFGLMKKMISKKMNPFDDFKYRREKIFLKNHKLVESYLKNSDNQR